MLTSSVLWGVPIAFGSVIACASADTIGPGGIWCYTALNAKGENEHTCENVGGEDRSGDLGGVSALPEAVIQISRASYGFNCDRRNRGNQTQNLTDACGGRVTCDYKVDYTVIGDPAPGCAKDYGVQYLCSADISGGKPPISLRRVDGLQAEAGFGSVLHLDCTPRIKVISATYGFNCGAPQGNQTANLAAACDGRVTCDYKVDYTVIGDPAPGCAKDYTVQNQCSTEASVRVGRLDAEAGFGSVAHLSCL